MLADSHFTKSAFVGRELELKELSSLLDRAKRSQGSFVFVTGEVGAGKSRLLLELQKAHRDDDMFFLKGRCQYLERADPFLPIYEMLRQYLEACPATDTPICGMISAFMPSVKRSMSPISTGPLPLGLIPMGAGEGEGQKKEQEDTPILPLAITMSDQGLAQNMERERINEALSEIFFEMSKERPMVMAIEDLQWADKATLLLLRFLGRSVSDKPILIIGTYTYEELDTESEQNPVIDMVKYLRSENLSKTIKVKRLDKANIKSMVKDLLQVDDVPTQIINVFYEKTQGNPYFLKEVIRGLTNDGTIDLKDPQWYNKLDPSHIKISSNLKETVAKRIQRLSPSGMKMLGYASVIGNTFHFDEIMALMEEPEDMVLDHIDELISSKMINEDPSSKDEWFRFDNPLVRDIAYEGLTKSRRRLLHHKTAQMIERKNVSDLSKVTFDLAYHYSRSRIGDKALQYLLKAGEMSLTLHSVLDATRYFTEAEAVAMEVPETPEMVKLKAGLYYDLGWTQEFSGEWDLALDYYNKALQISLVYGKPQQQAKIYRAVADIQRRRGMLEESEMNFRKSEQISMPENDNQGLAETYRGLGAVSWRKGDYAKAKKCYEQSVKFAKKIKATDIIAGIFIEMGNLYNYKGELDKAISHYQRALDMLKKGANHEVKARAYNNIGDIYLQYKDWDKAISFFKESERFAKESGSTYWLGWCHLNLAEAYAQKGELDSARGYSETAYKHLRKLDDRIGVAFALRNMGLIQLKSGEAGKAEGLLTQSIDVIKPLNVPYNLGETYMVYAQCLARGGKPDEAKSYLREAIKLFKSVDSQTKVDAVKELLKSIEG